MAIEYPYLPEGKEILYVPHNHPIMKIARNYAKEKSLDKFIPTASIVVKNGEVLGRGANGSDWHEQNECERVKKGIPTGQGYELCEGCHPKNHSEPRAIADARNNGFDPQGADLYLWGHWWACEPCWEAIKSAGIINVYLVENSEVLYNREAPENIIGRQFQYES